INPTIERGSISITPDLAIAYTSTVSPDIEDGELEGQMSISTSISL
ncbi:hypothetical protein LCGC14_1603580, partial [marine sediment metagenome]